MFSGRHPLPAGRRPRTFQLVPTWRFPPHRVRLLRLQIQMKDFRFSYKFKMACKEDVLRLCPNIKKKSVSHFSLFLGGGQGGAANAVAPQGGRGHLPQHHREERHAAGRQGAAGVAQVPQTAAGGGAGDGSAHTHTRTLMLSLALAQVSHLRVPRSSCSRRTSAWSRSCSTPASRTSAASAPTWPSATPR